MANNIKIEKIYIHETKLESNNNRYELRIDWSNDRHEALAINDLSPDSVKNALIEMAHFIAQEQKWGYL